MSWIIGNFGRDHDEDVRVVNAVAARTMIQDSGVKRSANKCLGRVRRVDNRELVSALGNQFVRLCYGLRLCLRYKSRYRLGTVSPKL